MLLALACVGLARAEDPTPAAPVPPQVEALCPKDGQNTVLGRLDAGEDAYVLVENTDGETGALFLYKFERLTNEASLVKASGSLFPFDPDDGRTPPKEIQQALAKLWAERIVAGYGGGMPRLEQYYRDNPDVWQAVPAEMKAAFQGLGLKAPAGGEAKPQASHEASP